MEEPHYVPLLPPHIPYNSYPPLTPLELSYSLQYFRDWMKSNWTYSLQISLLYLIAIFTIQIYMKNRQPFALRKLLTVWNFFLAIFSIFGTLRTWPEMGYILMGDKDSPVEKDAFGWHGSVCRRDLHNIGASFWGLLFTLSKALELGDTVFIVLRKQPLIFLHWYHHITVLTYTWYTYHTYDSSSRWFMVMNYPVHSLMYTYYGLKSLRLLRIPRQISMLITILQLAQMVIGLVVNLYAFYVKKFTGIECQVNDEHLYWALSMYGSYFLLFVRFFAGSYYQKKKDLQHKEKMNGDSIRSSGISNGSGDHSNMKKVQ